MMPDPHTPVTVDASNPVSSDQRSSPITREARLERLLVDPDALDRARRRALTAADLRALERRAGRARRGEQPVAVAEHDLGVRPDVDDQVHGLLLVRRLGQDHPGRVGADVSGDARQQVHARARVDVQIDVGRPAVDGAVRGQRERRAAELRRIDPQEQVMHDRVADDRERQDVGRIGVDLHAQVGDQLVDARADHLGQLRLRARVHHHVGHAAHQVLAEPDLRVHRAAHREHLAARQIAELSRDRRRADVERHAERAVAEPGPEADDRRAVVHRDRARSSFPRGASVADRSSTWSSHARPVSDQSRSSASSSRSRSPDGSRMSGSRTST